MKKKKRDNTHVHGHALTSVIPLIVHMRRRPHHLRLFPLASAFTACFLLLFVAFTLLSSPPPLLDHRRHLSNNGAPALDTGAFFRVPASGGSLARDLWSSSLSKFYYGCSNASDKFPTANVKTHSNRYLLIATSGGLNQQRTGITDAVVVAYILNATLVIPKLDHKSYWRDSSDFAEIFDVDWFISFLSKDVEIVKQLPKKRGKVVIPYGMRVPRKCTPKYYQNRVLPVLIKKHAVQLGKFDYRLSNRLDSDLQKLRCRVNYHALMFTTPIIDMGKKLVEKMRMESNHFIALHLRFEPDMLAFSGCDYGGGEKERAELGAIRKRWKSLHPPNPDRERRQGRCPLTPEEVGLMLRALGYGSDVHMYVASGEVYGGEETLTPLKALFPHFHSKETLASKEELEPFSSYSSRMAALDFSVCDESDVFVTNNNGNMARMLAGRRRYFGHKPTIRPNAKKLYKLFMNRYNLTWEEFASGVRTYQIGFMGEPNEAKPGRGEFHENPSCCICQDSEAKTKGDLIPRNPTQQDYKNGKENNRTENGEVSEDNLTEDDREQDMTDVDYLGSGMGQGKGVQSNLFLENGVLPKPEPTELDAFFSD